MSRDCRKILKDAYPDVDSKLIDAAIGKMEKTVEAFKANKSDASRIDLIREAAKQINEAREAAFVKRRSEMMDLMTTKRNIEFALTAFPDDPAAAGKALMASGEARIKMGGNKSSEGYGAGLKEGWWQYLATAVEQSGIGWAAARSGILDDQLAIELHALQGGGKYKPGQTGQPAIANLAKAIARLQQDALAKKQSHGSPVKELAGRIARASNNPAKMTGHKDEWVKYMADNLDRERSFKGLNDEQFKAALEREFHEITMGRTDVNIADGNVGVLGAGDVGKRLAAHREFHFKEPQHFAEYNRRFGHGSLIASVAMELAKDASDIGVMHNWGSEPDKVYTSWKQGVKKKLAGNQEALEKFNAAEADLDVMYKTMRGVSDAPGRSSGAKVVREGRSLIGSTRLGRAIFLAVPSDIINTALRVQNTQGENFLASFSKTLVDWAGTFASPETKTKALRDLRYMMQDYAGQHAADSGLKPGWFSKAHGLLWKYSGMNREAAVMAEVMARKTQTSLAEMAGSDLKSLNRYQQQQLKRFGFDESRWDVVRLGLEDVQGRKMMTAEAIAAIPDSKFEAAAKSSGLKMDGNEGKANLLRYRLETEAGYIALLQDNIRLATTTPGNREKAFLLGGTTEDQTWGMFTRLMTQFLATPLMLHQEMIRHTINAGGKDSFFASLATPSGTMGIVTRMTALLGAGYATSVLVALHDGLTPPDPTDPQTITESFVRGGGAAMWSDYMIGNYDKTVKQELGVKALGPVVGHAVDTWDIFEKSLKKGEPQYGQAINVLIKTIPGQNLWWSRAALDSLFFQRMQEWAAPGTARREEKRAKERGQEYFFNRPTENIGR